MAGLTLEHIVKTYEDGFTAVHDLSLEITDGQFVVLVGPSGCGKSTTLRMIAGLESITSGTLKIGDRVVNSVRPKDRDIAMVFQSYALYPHLSVAENLGFSLRMGKTPKAQMKARVDEAAQLLGLGAVLHKKPGQLSGGQRQRVALGRAIVRKPAVFLFDEPLSNLDPDRRATTRAEIKRLQRELGTTTVYVTHDHEEAMALGDVVVVMDQGRIEQAGPPAAVYADPKTLFVARFLGSPKMNVIECPVGVIDDTPHAMIAGDSGDRAASIPVSKPRDELMHADKVMLGIRPQHVGLGDALPPGHARLGAGRVTHVEHLGFAQDLTVEVGGHTLLVRDDAHRPRVIGEVCVVSFDPEQTHMY